MKPFESLSRLFAPPGRCGGDVRREAEAIFAGFVRTLGRLAVPPDSPATSGHPAWPARILQEKP